MGAQQSRIALASSEPPAMPNDHPNVDGSDPTKCPVNHEALAKIAESAKAQQQAAEANATKCPVDHKSMDKFATAASTAPMSSSDLQDERQQDKPKKATEKPVVYNVYGQKIDPDNMMPANPNQLPTAGQDAPLSQARVKSSIPKGGTNTTWSYPSPQIFYNSLTRKGKRGNISAKDVELVVAIHNNMNEHGWAEVMRWEGLHANECAQPKLLRFTGKPKDLSPMARIRSYLGYGIPFDRHDWIVDRNGKQVRYILDYYHYDDPQRLVAMGVRPGNSGETETKIVLDVRPALDSPGALVDRMRVSLAKFLRLPVKRVGGFSAPPDVIHTPLTKDLKAEEPPNRLKVTDQEEFQRLANLSAKKVRDLGAQFNTKCGKQMMSLQKATEENKPDAMRNAHAALRLCMSDIVCPNQASIFRKILNRSNVPAAEFDEAFENMDACVERFALAAARELSNEQTTAMQAKEEVHKSE